MHWPLPLPEHLPVAVLLSFGLSGGEKNLNEMVKDRLFLSLLILCFVFHL